MEISNRPRKLARFGTYCARNDSTALGYFGLTVFCLLCVEESA
jgi:hypothetical protein